MALTTAILDGYNVTAKIPGKGPWPDVEFQYRPLLAAQVCEFMDNPARGPARLKKICKVLEKQLVSWNVRKPGSPDEMETVPVTEDNLSKMPMSYLDEMLNAVLSYSSLEQDADPKN